MMEQKALEIIRFGQPSDQPPLLLIHGAYCGAWIWEKYFIPAFAAQGYYGAALSLRGHGNSPSRDQIHEYGLRDYVDDIRAGAALFPSPPVLIGHSMGGYLAQHYALDAPLAGLVLLSAPSLGGLSSTSMHISMRNPALAFQLARLMVLGPRYVDPRVIGDALFHGQLSEDEMLPMLPLLQQESNRVMVEAAWPQLRMPQHYPPTLVLGGDCDDFVPQSDFQYESVFWRGTLKIMPGQPHGLMLSPGWAEVLREITLWMRAHC